MNRSSLLLTAALAFVSCALAQAPATGSFSGCVMPLEGHAGFFTLCEPNNCSLLRGKVEPQWAGHTVKLVGVLREATSTQPRTLEVRSAVSVAGACTAVCRPSIPGRGLGPKDKPSGEGGTPGVVSPQPQ